MLKTASLGKRRAFVINATLIGVDHVLREARRFGDSFKAHVDKPAYSVTTSVGAIPRRGFYGRSAFRGSGEALQTNPKL